jgi:predicted GIY-YIG superfamily endonuclease
VTTTLYRFYAANGDLLYVGIAKNPLVRMQQHRSDKPWWTAVASSTYQHFNSRAEAARAETKAIRSEMPLCNIACVQQPRGLEPLGDITIESADWIRLERLDSRLVTLRDEVLSYDPCNEPHRCSDAFWLEIRTKLQDIVGWHRTLPSLDENDRYLSSQAAYEIAYAALDKEVEDCDILHDCLEEIRSA